MNTIIIIQRKENGEILAVNKNWVDTLLALSFDDILGSDVSFVRDGKWMRIGDCAVDWIAAFAGIFDEEPEAFTSMFPWLTYSIFET